MVFRVKTCSAVSTPSAMVETPRDWAIWIMASSRRVSLRSRKALRINCISSLSASMGSVESMFREEYPEPKSSISMRKPIFFSCRTFSTIWSAFSV